MMRPPQSAGFSLIELLVSMTIFSVVVTMSTGTLLVLLDANNKAKNMESVMSNLTFALDSMTREIRTGYNYYCAGSQQSVEGEDEINDCASGTYISIIEAGDSLTGGESSRRVSYYYNAAEQSIERRIADGSWVPLTANNVRITDMDFEVTGTTRGLTDEYQPTVTIFVAGEAGLLEGLDSSFELQTTVTQRPLDI